MEGGGRACRALAEHRLPSSIVYSTGETPVGPTAKMGCAPGESRGRSRLRGDAQSKEGSAVSRRALIPGVDFYASVITGTVLESVKV
jgi:hypothetical protein